MLIGTAATGAALVTPKAFGFFQDRPTLKVGLIGCGGRGSGAIRNSMEADPGVVLHAVGDAFEDRAKGEVAGLTNEDAKRVQVGDRVFWGLDAYKQVIASGPDIVILATPPAFRNIHLKAAIEAGKHVFMEKPVAVDGPGIRRVIEAYELAKQKNLNIVAGTQRRSDLAYMECMKRIHDGQMGDVVALYAWWNQGGLWSNKKEANWSDLEWQIRNWLYFTWLSGDHIVEQHVHNLDVCNWAMNAHPVKAVSLAGRQVRTDPVYGHIFDHFATEYEYANGVRMSSQCRQIDGCVNKVAEFVMGSKGKSDANNWITGGKEWKWEGERPNPYVLEHRRLINGIRSGKTENDAKTVAESTLTAIMGRMSAYSGQEVTWEQAFNSTIETMPANLSFDMTLGVPDVAVPGKTVAF